MSFSDNDLKQLKEAISLLSKHEGVTLKIDEFEALIARLECAEALAEHLYQEWEAPGCNDLYDAWLRSKGEDV